MALQSGTQSQFHMGSRFNMGRHAMYLEVPKFIQVGELCSTCQTPYGLEGAYQLGICKH
jgi:hypothetical protein